MDKPTAQPADPIRMQLLVQARDIADPKTRFSIFLNFFENDSSDAIRCEALRSLARLGWGGCEEQAIKLWNTHDEVSQMVALDVLSTIESSKFEDYFQQAKLSDKRGVQQTARAISTIRQCHSV